MELNLEELKNLKASEYIKIFKNKAFWKNKAKFAVFMLKCKLLDKKIPVAIALKKEQALKGHFKQIRKEKIHPLNKLALGAIAYDIERNVFIFTMTGGNASLEELQMMGAKLFDKMKVGFEVKIGVPDKEMQGDAADFATEVSDTEVEPEEELEDVAFDWADTEAKATTLFTKAQAYQKDPNTSKSEDLMEEISDFLDNEGV